MVEYSAHNFHPYHTSRAGENISYADNLYNYGKKYTTAIS